MSAESNWDHTKTILAARIRRRYIALQRLQNTPADPESIEEEIETCGDDAKALWALAERIDHALDTAMSPRLSRTPIPDRPLTTANDEFRSR